MSTIPKSVRDLALAHKVNVGRDEHGNYFIRDPKTGKWAAHTASANPTVEMAKAMIRRYVKARKKNPADSVGTFKVKIESVTDSPQWDYRVTVSLGKKSASDLVSGGMATVDAAVKRLKDSLARGKNPRRRNPRVNHGYKVFKAQGYDVRYLGHIDGPYSRRIQWFPTAGNAARYPTKNKAVAVAQNVEVAEGWQVGVAPYNASLQSILARTRGKA